MPLLVPSSAQLASHLYSDNENGKAQAYFEAALRERGSQRELVLPLAKIASERGEHSQALAMLHSLKAHDLSVTDRELLRQELRAVGRTGDYISHLLALRRQAPQPELLRELARLYGEQHLLELQVDALEDLYVLRSDDSTLAMDIAHLHWQLGNADRAFALLSRVWQHQPLALAPADFELLVTLHIEREPTDAGATLLRAHGGDFGLSTDGATLAGRFFAAGRFADAKRVLDPLIASGTTDARAIESWARSMVALGHSRQALQVLRGRIAADGSTATVTGLLCGLALEQGDTALALELATAAKWQGVDGRVALWLASSLAAARDLPHAALALKRVDEQALAADPVTAVYLFGLLGQRDVAAQWADMAAIREDLAPAQVLWLAELELGLGRLPRVTTAALRYAAVAPIEAHQALPVAALLWRSGASDKGLQVFDLAMAGRSAHHRAARALLLAAAGRMAEALAVVESAGFWSRLLAEASELAAHPGHWQPHQWLQALAQLATTQGSAAAQVYAYGHMLQLRPNQLSVQLALTQAHFALNQPQLALALLAELPANLPTADRTAVRVTLLAAWRAGSPVRTELVVATVAYLRDAELRDTEPQSWVHLLLELSAEREALEFVAKLAVKPGGAWTLKHLELLSLLGDHAELLAQWRKQGLDASQPAADRLAAAQQLLKVGDRGIALQVFQQVAGAEGAQGPTVQQWLNLVGPRPTLAAVQWLTERARTAAGDDKLG